MGSTRYVPGSWMGRGWRHGVLLIWLLVLLPLPQVRPAAAADGADVAVEVSVVDDVATPQVFAVAVRNNGPADAEFTEVEVDAGGQTLGRHTADPRPGTRDDGVGCVADTQRISCQHDRIGSGDTITFTVEVHVEADATLTAVVRSAGTPDPNPTVNNTDTVLLRPATADLGVQTTMTATDEQDAVVISVVVDHHGGRAVEGTLEVTGAPLPTPEGCGDARDGWVCALGTMRPDRRVGASMEVTRPEPDAAPLAITFTVRTEGLTDPDASNDSVTVTVHPRDTVPGDVRRHSGTERIRTAVAVSTAAFPEGADTAVLARADDFADALAGAPLAARLGGPILLTHGTGLDEATAAELDRLLPPGATVHLLGGSAAIGQRVADSVAARGHRVRRHAGPNRYGTAAVVADAIGTPTTVAVADGDTFPDAVVAAAAMAAQGGALVLTSGSRLPEETAAWAARADWAVGRAAAQAVPRATGLVGVTPAETSVVVAATLFQEPTTVGIATTAAFPDALAGGPLTARAGAPLLLTDGDRLDHPVADYLADHTSITTAHLFGGVSALSSRVEEEVRALLSR